MSEPTISGLTGTVTSSSYTITKPDWKFCPECGERLTPEWNYCAKCGKQIAVSPYMIPCNPVPVYPLPYTPYYPWPIPKDEPYITWTVGITPANGYIGSPTRPQFSC